MGGKEKMSCRKWGVRLSEARSGRIGVWARQPPFGDIAWTGLEWAIRSGRKEGNRLTNDVIASCLSFKPFTVEMNSLLPPELWDYVLTFIDPASLQSTALVLSRAIPSSSISPSLLWRHLHLSRESQSLQCIAKLRGMDQGVRESIKTVRATAFRSV